MRKGVLVAMLAASAIVLSGCGTDTASVPNVTGYRLDAAHNVLKEAGFEKFEDVDAIGSRSSLMDSNWVVLDQSPEADEEVDPKTKVRLGIAKPGDDGVYDRLPVGSPVYEEIQTQRARDEEQSRQQKKRDEERSRQQDAQDKKDVSEFVDRIDPAARIALNAIADLNDKAAKIAAQGGLAAVDSYNIADTKSALGTYWDMLEDAPSTINDSADSVQEAIRTFQQAADTLKSAEGAASSSSIARFEQLYSSARIKYNSGLTAMYRGTSVSPPTV